MMRFKIEQVEDYRRLVDRPKGFSTPHIKIQTSYNYKLNKKLKHKLDILINDLEDNDDAVIIVFGPEGAGKTYFASQIYDYINSKLNNKYSIDDVHFEGQTYMDKSLASNNLTINCMDESRRALNKMRTTSGNNVSFMDFLSECRSQNQVHIILLPAYTDLDQYVAIHRVKLLLSVEKHREPITGKLIRGIFNIWTTKKKWLLKKAWDGKYKEPPREMLICKGKFDNVLCFNKKEYDAKKEQAKKDRYMTKPPELTEKQQEVFDLVKQGYTQMQIADMLNKHQSGIAHTIKTIRKKLPESI